MEPKRNLLPGPALSVFGKFPTVFEQQREIVISCAAPRRTEERGTEEKKRGSARVDIYLRSKYVLAHSARAGLNRWFITLFPFFSRACSALAR